MESMDKLTALSYLTANQPICDNCLRGNLEQVRMAAGLYQLVKDIMTAKQETFSQEDLDTKIREVTTF
jgi:hypothetical protein